VYKREIAAKTIASLAYQWDVPYFETSAKYNRHVNEPFEDLVLQMRRKNPAVATKQSKGQQKGGCIVM
jgi:hypothetical protein